MLKNLKKQWRHFVSLPAGKRFVTQYEEHRARRSSPWARALAMGAGFLLLAVGLVGLVAPGPGLLGVAFGAALIAREFRWLAKALDRTELFLRRQAAVLTRAWKRASTPVRVALIVTALAVAGAALWFALHLLGWIP